VWSTTSITASELKHCGVYLNSIGPHAAKLQPKKLFVIFASLTWTLDQASKCSGTTEARSRNILVFTWSEHFWWSYDRKRFQHFRVIDLSRLKKYQYGATEGAAMKHFADIYAEFKDTTGSVKVSAPCHGSLRSSSLDQCQFSKFCTENAFYTLAVARPHILRWIRIWAYTKCITLCAV